MLRQYIPGFEIKEGHTFQVNTDIPKAIDFLVGELFLEFHPVALFHGGGSLGSFASYEEYQTFKDKRDSLPPDERAAYITEVKAQLLDAYFAGRRTAIDESPRYHGWELAVVQSPEELYDTVITRLGIGYPTRTDFVREFRYVAKQVRAVSKSQISSN